MNVRKRDLAPGGGKAPAGTATSMSPKGAGAIKNSVAYKPQNKALGMIKGAATCPNGAGRNSKY